jgi:predicted thioesterase
MKPELVPGTEAGFAFIVTDDMLAGFDGEVVHPVLSTVSMIYHMEKAGRHIILPYLEPDEEGAGYEICVKHVGPAVRGQTVRVKAVCTEVTPKRVVCEVLAETDLNLVGTGHFTQAIFRKSQMADRIAALERQVRPAERRI